jgi:predicted nucleic acid-binding protein
VNVVDASVALDLLSPELDETAPARILFRDWAKRGTEAVAPGLMWLEVRNVLLTGIRRGRWSGADADAAAEFLRVLPVRRMDSDLDAERAFELARRYDNWPVFDMLYVALAERLGAEFYTSDERLSRRLAHLGWVREVGSEAELGEPGQEAPWRLAAA